MTDCIFCRIVAGESPATTVFEDDDVIGFLDIRPITRGHTLIVPKRHATNLEDLDPDLGLRIFAAGHRLAQALRRSDLGADGAHLLINDGAAAFQTVHHVHLHVIPRSHGDRLAFARGFLLRRPHHPESTAAALRAGLDRFEAKGFEAGGSTP
jgi:histidine triad (HIT) family protein